MTKVIHKFKEPTVAECKCDCGNVIVRPITYLTSGDTTSCGCLQKQRASETNVKDFSGVVSNYGVTLISQNKKNNKGQWLWNCKCGFCGAVFVALPAKVLNGHIRSCGCIKKSSGEKMVEKVLIDKKIDYVREYKLVRSDSNVPLKLDFYLPDYNIGIEYQGQQHYKPVDYFGGQAGFERRQQLDALKKDLCGQIHIKLYEINYDLSFAEIERSITNIIYPERLSCLSQ